MNYEEKEKIRKMLLKDSEEYFKEFDEWLTAKGLTDRAIEKHLCNAKV